MCPCPGAIYMYKSINIYTRTRCQVSVYRTTGPLVENLDILTARYHDLVSLHPTTLNILNKINWAASSSYAHILSENFAIIALVV